MTRRFAVPLTLFVVAALVAACSGGAPTATQVPPATQLSAGSTPHSSSTASSDAFHLNLVADGTQARYRVREQLAALSLPSDAIGRTSAVTGSVVINSD